MAILLDTKNRVFTLQTNHSMYQMKADRYGVLLHTLFGEKGSVFDYSYLITYADRGFSGNPYDVDDERTYSLDALPQEYPTYGSGDYRGSALKVRYPDGTTSCELRYVGYEVLEGKYSIPGLPAIYQMEENKADTLVITLEDTRKTFMCIYTMESWKTWISLPRSVRIETTVTNLFFWKMCKVPVSTICTENLICTPFTGATSRSAITSALRSITEYNLSEYPRNVQPSVQSFPDPFR